MGRSAAFDVGCVKSETMSARRFAENPVASGMRSMRSRSVTRRGGGIGVPGQTDSSENFHSDHHHHRPSVRTEPWAEEEDRCLGP